MTFQARTKRSLILLLTLSLSTWPSVSGILKAGQHAESAPHRCVGCASGTCKPRNLTYGHYQPLWRKWPGATTYQGYRREPKTVEVPELRVPDAVNEGRTTDITRSDRPLDPESGGPSDAPVNGMPEATEPGALTESEENPFNTFVDEAELPVPNTNNVFNAEDDFGIGGDVDNGLQEFNDALAPPTGENDNLFNGDEAAPDGKDTIPFENSPADSPSNGPGEVIDFGLLPPPQDSLTTSGAVRSIKNRRPDIKRTIDELPKPIEVFQNLDLPTYDIIGGDFSAADLTESDSLPQSERQGRVKPTSFEQETSRQEKTDASGGFVAPHMSIHQNESAETSNPIRRHNFAPSPDAHPMPIQSSAKQLIENNEVTLQAAPQSTTLFATSSAPSQPTAVTARTLANAGHRSIRDTLRRNPLR